MPLKSKYNFINFINILFKRFLGIMISIEKINEKNQKLYSTIESKYFVLMKSKVESVRFC